MQSASNKISRRHFVRLTGMGGAALTIGFFAPALASAGEYEILTSEEADALGVRLNAWVSIDTSGKVTLVNHRSEMGQGSWQSVPQIIAEELEVSMDDILIEFAPGHQSMYGSQITGGSSTVRTGYQRLLRTGATAREMLIEAAANQWKVAKTECYAQNGQVIHKASGKKLGYGELVTEASKLTPPKEALLKARKDYKLVGKPLPRKDNPMKVNGSAIFGLDKTLPGMLYAVVERSPRFWGNVKSFDPTAALAVPGVKKVVKVQMPVFAKNREGVAVLATNTWAAMQGRKVLKVEWDNSGLPAFSTESVFRQMTEDLEKPGNVSKKAGDIQEGLDKAEKKVEAIYQAPYQSHSCMEPMCCLAHVKEGKVEVWAPTQAPDWVQRDLGERLKMKPEDITVNMTFLGGGFGRKAFMDYTTEAVLLSKEAGAPVQVVWTREDDMTQGPFRPGALYKFNGGLSGGKISVLQLRFAGQNMDLQNDAIFKKDAANNDIAEGFCPPYYKTIPNFQFSDVPTELPIPVMWWRAVYSSTNGFAFESFVDEMAIAAGKDPLDFRRSHLNDARYQALMDKMEQVSGWKKRSKNSGYGVAITECFGSIVGEVVKVSKADIGGVKVDKVWVVFDCGWYVNPDIIKAQAEGSVIMAYGAATTHQTTFADGKAVESNFLDYNLPRIGEINDVEVHIIDNDEKAGGVGEPSLPPFAAALCNAIFDLTGKRVRKLPFSMQDV
jgi:isoquinoline 1-oxidoreductase beta subunit